MPVIRGNLSGPLPKAGRRAERMGGPSGVVVLTVALPPPRLREASGRSAPARLPMLT